jgi:phosphoserine phosphatase RsbX
LASKLSRAAAMVEWGAAARPCPGHTVSGDASVVRPFSGGVLLAVVDGLGRDHEAALAARTAAAVLEKYAAGPVVSLVRRCHRSLMMTRGAVITVASVDFRANLAWLGIGNVQALLIRGDAATLPAVERLRLLGGVVGYQMPILEARKAVLRKGDVLGFATDGISGDWAGELRQEATPVRLARRVLAAHFNGNDDGLILVVRYLGASHE